MNLSYKSVITQDRSNKKDLNNADMMASLSNSLYESKNQSLATSAQTLQFQNNNYIKMYDSQQQWGTNESLNSTQVLYKSQQHFSELEDQLRQSKHQFYTTNNLDYNETRDRYKNGRRPQYLIEMSEENKKILRQQRLEESNKNQKILTQQYNDNIVRQKERKIKQEQENVKMQEERERIAQEIKQKKQEEFQKQQQIQQDEIAIYRESILQKELENMTTPKSNTDEQENSFSIEQQKQLLFNNQELIDNIKNKPCANIKELQTLLKSSQQNQLELIYKAYLFIHFHISFNYKEFKTGKQTSDLNPDKILEAQSGTALAQSKLFSEILGKFNIKSQTVQGISKSSHNYTLGQKYKGNENNHAWNIVEFQGDSYFVDVCMGGGYVQKENYFKKLDNQFFFTPNIEFAYTHYPSLKKYQLLKKSRQWTLQKFQGMPLYSSYYFQNQIQLFNYNTQYQIQTNTDSIIIDIKNKDKDHLLKAVISKILNKPLQTIISKKKQQENQQSQQNIQIENPENQQQQHQQKENLLDQIDIKLNQQGTYIVELFAVQKQENLQDIKKSQDLTQQNLDDLDWNKLVQFEIQLKSK